MRFRIAAAAAAAVVLVAGGQAHAATSVGITGVAVEGTAATVTGTATFDAPAAADVGGSVVGFTEPLLAGPLGLDLVSASIEPVEGGLRFTWQMSSLPAVVPPELVRYTWAFRIGTNQYQLQAKTTNIGSITTAEDPQGHLAQLVTGTPFFQLRGRCTASYEGTPVSGCYHLAFLDGAFDTANGRVSMDVPYGTEFAPDLVPGAVIEEQQTAGMSITAALQAVVSNTAMSQYINGWNPYYTGPVVDVGIGNSAFPPEAADYVSRATLSDDDFTGSVEGLDDFNDTVFARACIGGVCSYDSAAAA